ncbi:MAG: oxidoreductase [Burkholderiales bacterium]|jgi:NAD(P)-dependent dehydrogenase (short-subunit alcohol dehydrogenase family)|nr:oxidoreductase [Burkholderiales bacterium]
MQVAVVSGGSSGIGDACVNKFLQNKYFVYNLDIASKEISNENYRYIQTDISNSKQIKQSINKIINENRRIDTLIISAGKHLSATIENTDDKQLMDLVSLNMLGAFWLIQSVIPYMKNQKRGTIITIGSDQSTIAKNNSAAYGMTKAALASLTKSTALDYAKYNIRANCIGAGTIDTPLYRSAIAKYSGSSGISLAKIEQEEALLQPVGRIGKPEEVAELAYFLASDKVSFITGALIPIDGGYTAR